MRIRRLFMYNNRYGCWPLIQAVIAAGFEHQHQVPCPNCSLLTSFDENSEGYNMKCNLSTTAPFCEQVNELTRMFSQWNPCEQTVVIYALLRYIPAVQARFLAEVVQHKLHSVSQLDAQEIQANNTAFIQRLRMESTETAIHELLLHLPLLKPGNLDCKKAYLDVIPEIIGACATNTQFTYEAQQLLSYTLIHPALTCHDRRSLHQWLRYLEERIKNTPTTSSTAKEYTNTRLAPRLDNLWSRRLNDMFNMHLSTSTFGLTSMPPPPPPPPPSQPPQPISRQRRSNSLTPPAATSHHHELVDRANNAANASRHKPRSFSVSGDHASSLIGLGPLSPQGSCASSGSEGRLDDASNRPLASGMRDVAAWLKTLRLHKYSYLFTSMSYEDMLALTEEKLATQGVTKGARHKLAISIGKLNQRYNTLQNLEKDLQSTDGQVNSFTQGPPLLISTIDELKTILSTPMKPSQEGDPQDIPTQFIKVLGKLFNKIALEPDDNIQCAFSSVLEKVTNHQCFSPSQQDRARQWRNKLGNPRQVQKWQNYGYGNRKYGNSQQHNRKPGLNSNNVHNTHTTHSGHSYMVSPHRNSTNSLYYQGMSQGLGHIRPASVEKRSSLQENSLQQVQNSFYRTNSAPRDHFIGPETSGNDLAQPIPDQSTDESMDQSTTEPDINSSLAALCLRMTEQAIGNET
ncbi:PREDICTED: protein Smaug isoform X2 [Dinoponera quadriceps]|uniref:Protein Smaug n=1 Tax=Dinoponera quadriceps TaxID=609295 RepID=A0A6P3Y5H8_DINQU|nr:PREDICTED: protein Smaug isoform X2 [Dinoponera quadriceps]